jgi:hypothetical protein
VPPSAEYLQRDGNLALLQALAQLTGGRTDLPASQVWEPTAATPLRTQPITWPLLWLAALLWPLDIAVRRLLPRMTPAMPQTLIGWRRTRTAPPPAAPAAPQAAAPASPSGALDRQRARIRSAQRAQPAAPLDGADSAAPPAAEPAPAFDWRKTRRSVVERPGERKQE